MRVHFKKRSSEKLISRQRKKIRIRKNIIGTAERPRLTVFRSQRFLAAQIIDDDSGKTLVGFSSKKLDGKNKKNIESAKAMGIELAKIAQSKNIKNVVFDRNGFLYHGKIKAFADAAREGGLEF